MVSNRSAAPRGSVTDLIAGLLDRGYNQVAQPVLNAVARSTSSGIVQQRLTELDTEVARLTTAGDPLRPDNPVLRALLADLEDTLRADARLIDGAAEAVQSSGSAAAGRVQRQLALPGMTDAQIARLGIRWNSPDPEAVARLVQYSGSDAWANLLARYGDDVLSVVTNQAVRGVALGWGPLRSAGEIRRLTEAFPAHVANNLLRTLQLTSYRDATAVHQQENLAICQQIIRIAALDARTCLSCIAQHGDVIWDAEVDATAPVPRVNDHHSGRCTSVMRVKGRPPLNIQSGEEWFASLPPERQAQQASFAASPGKLQAYRDGRVGLRDFVHPYNDRAFGPMVRESSLSAALGRPGRRIATSDGFLSPDSGSPGDDIDSLREFLFDSDGPLSRAISGDDLGMMVFNPTTGQLDIDAPRVRLAAKIFVAESMNFQYGKDYLLSLVQEQAAQNGVNVRGAAVERLYNDRYRYRAQAIQAVARIGGIRLTPAQVVRLQQAIDDGMLSMQYTTERSERGSLETQGRRRRASGLTDIELRQARANFRDWVQGID